jgi:hypothetical protein
MCAQTTSDEPSPLRRRGSVGILRLPSAAIESSSCGVRRCPGCTVDGVINEPAVNVGCSQGAANVTVKRRRLVGLSTHLPPTTRARFHSQLVMIVIKVVFSCPSARDHQFYVRKSPAIGSINQAYVGRKYRRLKCVIRKLYLAHGRA